MAVITWQAFKVVGATFTLLNDLQSINFTVNRANVQDPFRSGVYQLSGRNPSTLPTLAVGDRIVVKATDDLLNDRYLADTRLADLQINYGFTSNLDRWSLTLEDSLANAGRTVATVSWPAGYTTFEAAEDLCTAAGVSITGPISPQGSSFVSAQTLTNANVLQTLQTLIQTEQGRIYGSETSITWLGRANLDETIPVGEFNDGTLTATPSIAQLKFDNIQFAGLADNFATKVVVEPDGLASQSSGTGSRIFTLNSFDQTTSQAADLAGFVKSTLDESVDVPYTVGATLSEQDNYTLLTLIEGGNIGAFVNVVLRGVRYQAVVNGATVSADPSDTRVLLNLTSALVYNFFRLDSTVYGILNTSKLGF
jgi:hypothetical protein